MICTHDSIKILPSDQFVGYNCHTELDKDDSAIKWLSRFWEKYMPRHVKYVHERHATLMSGSLISMVHLETMILEQHIP